MKYKQGTCWIWFLKCDKLLLLKKSLCLLVFDQNKQSDDTISFSNAHFLYILWPK